MAVKIRFVSDYVCPYCLAAKAPLLEAVRDRDVEIEWLPYELTREPAPRVDTYHDEERRAKWSESLVPIVERLGIDMKLPPKVIPRPYTRLAFEGFHYAKEHGRGDAWNDRVYEAYFAEELDIGDMDVLCGLAEDVGLNAEELRRVLIEGIYTRVQSDAAAYARDALKVRVVPTIFIGETRIEGDVYTREGFERILDAMSSEEVN